MKYIYIHISLHIIYIYMFVYVDIIYIYTCTLTPLFQVERSILFTNPGVLGSVGWMVSWHFRKRGRQVGVNTIKWYQSLGSYDVLYIQICIYIYIYSNIYIYTYILRWCMFLYIGTCLNPTEPLWVNNLFVFVEGNASNLYYFHCKLVFRQGPKRYIYIYIHTYLSYFVG